MSEVDTKLNKVNGNGSGEPAANWNGGRAGEGTGAYLSAESSLRSFRDEAEIHAISNALKRTNWNRKRAAQLLSISYRGLLYKIRRHNITPAAGVALKTVTDNGEVQS
ncbi:MAG TPA: helix-turn-helix domain-containing protein [Candidatus Sulfotelmatobacter sp.]